MRSIMVPMLLEHASRRGCSVDSVADRLDIPATYRKLESWCLDAPALEADVVVRLADAIASALDDPQLGLHMAAEVARGAFGVQEYAFRNAPTLGHAARRLARYQHLTNDSIHNDAGQDEDCSWVGFRIPGRPEGLGPHLDTYLLGVTLRFVRDLGGASLRPIAVEFSHAEPFVPRPALAAFFDCEQLHFGAGRSVLAFVPEVWDLPIADADPALLPVLDAYAQQLMPTEDTTGSWRTRVRDHLRRQLSGGAPTLEECANALGVTVRTLQRRLQDEGDVTYRRVVDDLRQEEARRMVTSTELPMDEISFLLGFSERRAFARAFVRWTGTTPTRYREERANNE